MVRWVIRPGADTRTLSNSNRNGCRGSSRRPSTTTFFRVSTAPRIGLALGGGGIAGYAFHAGVLGAIQEMTGWDPRTSEVMVGTSAGSGIVGLLRGGVAVPELVSRMLSISSNPSDMARLRQASGRGIRLNGNLWFGPSSPKLLARELKRLHRLRPANLMVGALPNGRIENDVLGDQAAKLHDSWPAGDTWITAVSLDTGDLVVFGRDEGHDDVDFADAVAASCAIPGFFRPVRINGRRYVDGGMRSMVNVDLLADQDLDLVVVLAPMSIESLSTRSPFASVLRGYSKLQLSREVAELEEAGIPCLTIEPDRSTTRAMGVNPMDPTSVVPSLTVSAATATAKLAGREYQAALALLRDAGLQLESPPDVPYPD